MYCCVQKKVKKFVFLHGSQPMFWPAVLRDSNLRPMYIGYQQTQLLKLIIEVVEATPGGEETCCDPAQPFISSSCSGTQHSTGKSVFMPPISPPTIIVAGPPASGKTTQSKIISETLGVVYVSTESALADAISSESDAGNAAKMFLDDNKTIPHDIYASLLSERIKCDDCQKLGWVLDGFPCTSQEFETFQILDIACDVFVFLDVPTPVLIDRAEARRANSDTINVNHVNSLPNILHVEQHVDDYYGEMAETLNFFQNQLIHVKGNRGISFVKDEILSRVLRAVRRTVVFVIGGPGTGKRTHCDLLATHHGYAHLSPKELINQEQYFDSDISNEIDRMASRAQDIPARIIIQLLSVAMNKAESNKFVVDSFPRNVEDLECWYDMMSDECVLDFVLLLDCPLQNVCERVMTNKDPSLQSSASVSSIVKKQKQFLEECQPVVNQMNCFGRVRNISTASPIAVVNKSICRVLNSLVLLPPYGRSLCLLKPDVVSNGNVPAILTAINKSHLAIIFTKFITMTTAVVEDFFANSPLSKNKSFKKHVEFMQSGPSLLLVVEGSAAIRRLQELVGCERAADMCSKLTLRSEYGTDSIRDGFYCSPGEREAMRDISYWMCPNETAVTIVPDDSSRQFSVEDTVALIKPRFADSCYEDIVSIIVGHGFEIISECRVKLTPWFLCELYPEMKADDEAFSEAREYLLSGPVVALQLRRESALKGWRHLIGSTDFEKTQEERFDSVRFKFGVSAVENAVHASCNSLVAENELHLFFPMLKYSGDSDCCSCGGDKASEKPKTSRRKKRKQGHSSSSSTAKPSALHAYMRQDVNPVLKELVRNIAIQKPKDIMGYAINDLIEKQKMDALKIGTKKRLCISSISSSLSALPSISRDHNGSLEKDVSNRMPPALMMVSSSDSGTESLGKARVEIARLHEAIASLSANIVQVSESEMLPRPPLRSVPVPVPAPPPTPADRTLRVLSMANLVGFGNTHRDLLQGNSIACLSATVKTFQRRHGSAMVLFTGNFLGCTHTLDSSHFSSMISLVDNLGINYGLLGNRDFEFGWEDVHNHLKFSQITWIASNIVRPHNGQSFKNVEEKVLVDWHGVRVGLVGVVDDWVSHSVSLSRSSIGGSIRILDPVDTATRLCAELKSDGAEVILIMSHCERQEINDALCALGEVQIVVAGHAGGGFRPWRLSEDSVGVATGDIAGVSSVTITLDGGQRKPPAVAWPPNYIVVDHHRQPYDVVDSIVSSLREEAAVNDAVKLGATSVTLSAPRHLVRTGETNVGNMLTDMMRHYSQSDIAVLHAGAIYCDEDLSPGLISIGDVVDLLPYDDYVGTVTLTGAQVVHMLNNSVSRAPSADGRFLQVSGLSFEFTTDSPGRDRCFNVAVDKQPISLTALYTCTCPGWLLEGHDGYKFLKEVTMPTSKQFCPFLIQVIFSSFRERMLASADMHHRELTAEDFDSVGPLLSGRIVLAAGTRTKLLQREENASRRGSVSSDGAVGQLRGEDDQLDSQDEDEDDGEGGIDFGARNVLSSKF